MLVTLLRLGCFVVVTTLLFSCAVQQHIKASIIVVEQPALQLARTIEAQSISCWQKVPSFFKNGMRVKSFRSVQGTLVISVANWVAGRGAQTPFLNIEIAETSPSAAQLTISGTQSKDIKRYTNDVESWVSGSVGCLSNRN